MLQRANETMRHLNPLPLTFAMLAAVVVTLSSCSTTNSKVGAMLNLDTDLELSFQVDSDINPNESGRPAPVFVRLYELKSPKLFNEVGFIDILERDQEVLGADFAAKRVLKPFSPGHNRVERMVLGPETKAVGLYAEFLRYKGARYKVLIPVVTHSLTTNSARIHLTGNQMTVVDR
jgi:type VI secretion system protein VasD